MSKNLEKEYRAFVSSEVPDLWSRIEVGLNQKTPADSPVSKFDSDSDTKTLHRTSLHKTGRRRMNKVWAGLAVACVCVVLILPAMMRTRWTGGSSGSASNDMASNSMPQSMDSYDMAEKVQDNGAYIDGAAGGAQEAVCEDSAAEAAEVTVDDSAVHPDLSAGAENASDGALNAGVDNVAANHFEVTVEILDIDVRTNSEILYTARVVMSDNPDLQAGSEIKILSPAILSEGATELGNAETYELQGKSTDTIGLRVTELENAKTYELVLCEKDSNDNQQEKTYVIVEE